MRFGGLATVAATALLAAGCAVAPQGRGGQSVTHDAVNYLHREWPLNGPPVIPADACMNGCSCCGGGSSCETEPACDPVETWSDDWNQAGCCPTAMGYTDDPPPAVPLEAAPRGRFFPAPVRPVFSPQGPSEMGFGTNVEADR